MKAWKLFKKKDARVRLFDTQAIRRLCFTAKLQGLIISSVVVMKPASS